MKPIRYILILLFLCSFVSCWRTPQIEQNKQSDFFFRIPESDMGITCSKRSGAVFYVMFSKDSTQLSDSVDYIKYKTGPVGDVNLIFNPQHRNTVYIRETENLNEIHAVHYNLQVLKTTDFSSQFIKVDSLKKDFFVPKEPLILVGIGTSTFTIFMKKREVVTKRIKEGDIHGGW